MAKFPPTGNQYDFYAVDSNINFAWIKGSSTSLSDKDIPIRLQRGEYSFGAFHIVKEHGAWLDKNGKTVEEMVWFKLQQSGAMYTTENNDKLKINIVLSPKALLVIRYITGQNPFFTIVTLYQSDDKLDGQFLGKYAGNDASNLPTFQIPQATALPHVTFKKSRTFVKP